MHQTNHMISLILLQCKSPDKLFFSKLYICTYLSEYRIVSDLISIIASYNLSGNLTIAFQFEDDSSDDYVSIAIPWLDKIVTSFCSDVIAQNCSITNN